MSGGHIYRPSCRLPDITALRLFSFYPVFITVFHVARTAHVSVAPALQYALGGQYIGDAGIEAGGIVQCLGKSLKSALDNMMIVDAA